MTAKNPSNKRPLQNRLLLRRLSQFLFLGLFLFLFIHTDYSGADDMAYAVNILFRLDPFLAATVMLASKVVIALMVPAIAVLLLALVVGRAFCGWFCPMGALLDGCRHGVKSDRAGKNTIFPRLGLWLFIVTLLLAFCGFHVAGYVDPFSILVRGLAQAFYPAAHGMTESVFTFTYLHAPDAVNNITEPMYSWLKETIIPAERKYFQLAFLSFAILGGVMLLEMAQKRFFCRNICPLGAMFGLLSRYGLMRGRGGDKECGKCRVCSSLCRMGAINENRDIDMSRCNLCLECQVRCPRQVIRFGFSQPKQTSTFQGLSRRQFIGAIASAMVLPSVKEVRGLTKWSDPLLIRPPGALPEDEFVGRCVRCAECVQVCIGNGLQPAFLEGGLDAIFTPKLTARTGYCEFNCTLCGQVCPTGAIRQLTRQEKHLMKIGNAWFDRDLCLPHAKGIPCMVCEEHCPTPVKAIQFREATVINSDGAQVTVKQPYIIDDLCIGCGICEYKCPLPGRPGIFVTSGGEHRNPEHQLPGPEDFYGS